MNNQMLAKDLGLAEKKTLKTLEIDTRKLTLAAKLHSAPVNKILHHNGEQALRKTTDSSIKKNFKSKEQEVLLSNSNLSIHNNNLRQIV